MSYKVAIPSYNRVDQLLQKTLPLQFLPFDAQVRKRYKTIIYTTSIS